MSQLVGGSQKRRGGEVLGYAVVAAIPLAAAGGPYLLPLPVIGLSLFAFRIVVPLACAWFLLANRGSLKGDRWMLWLGGGVGLGWVLWGVASLFWAADVRDAILDLASVMVGWTAVAAITQGVGSSLRSLAALRRGWIGGFVAVSAIAAWEISTGRHLPSAFVDQHQGAQLSGLTITATFSNPNNFAAFLLFVVPLLCWELAEARGFIWRFFIVTCIPTALALIALTGARLAMVGILVEGTILVVALCHIRIARRWISLALLGTVAVVGIVIANVPTAQAGIASMWSVGAELAGSGSAAIRENMIRSGLLMVEESGGAGIGAGNFSDAIWRGHSIGYIGGISNPHNLGNEIASEYGVVVLVLCSALFMTCGIVALRQYWLFRREHNAHAVVRISILLSAGAGYIFAASESSAYIGQPVNWTMLGTLAAMLAVWRAQAKWHLADTEADSNMRVIDAYMGGGIDYHRQ